MQIVPPSTADVDALADLWVALARGQRAYRSHIRAEPNRLTAREAIARAVVTDRVRVARDPDLVGFVMYDVEAGRYDQDVVRGVVHNVYVTPDHRGEGVGSALLAAAEAELAEAGADVVALEAMADNEAALDLYERRGYRPHRVELEKRVDASQNDTHSSGD